MHAYLIIAHNEFDILKKTIQMIDDERNDIYIHIDKKCKNFDFQALSAIPKKVGCFLPTESVSIEGISVRSLVNTFYLKPPLKSTMIITT